MEQNNFISDTKVETLYYFTDTILKVAYDITVDNHHSNHANSIITIVPKNSNIGIDTIHINEEMEEMANIYAKLLNQYKLNYRQIF